jgi:type II secretory pathway pseudopilin PulG
LPLTSKDLFRNFLIRTLITLKAETGDETLNPIAKWQELEDNYQLDTEFISRYVESKLGKKQRYSAFNDIDEIYKKGFKDSVTDKKAIHFYKDIAYNLGIYTRIVTENLGDFNINTYVASILQGGNRAITVSLLLTLFRNETDKTNLLRFLKAYERYILHLQIAARKRFNAPTIYEVIQALNKKDTATAIQKFILTPKELNELKTAIDGDDFQDNHVAKLFIVRYYWAIQENEADTVYQELLYKNISLEHIIPQQPDTDSNWLSDFDADFREKFTFRLGNMTLLTKSKNSKANNFDWKRKRAVYKRTNLAMTLSLAEKIVFLPSDIENRQKHIVETLITALDL